ncbi:MAG: hypothetical protein JXO44_06240, partial [Clostridia bacterium]|nr:hypothetical protein [Clostridia bacterium]
MASTFGGLNICSAGLYSSQTKLYTANVNIANAAVKGYSSQTVEQSCGYTTSVQNGVVVSSVNADALTVSQEQSAYLNQRYWNEMPDLGEWETKSASLAQMETILDELEET